MDATLRVQLYVLKKGSVLLPVAHERWQMKGDSVRFNIGTQET